jgi:hypothetical protein
MPAGKPTHKPVRLSAHQASLECNVTTNKVKLGLKQNGIAPGNDGRYSLKEIVLALSSRSGLELKAKEAKFQRQIDEAEDAKTQRDERRGKLAKVEKLKDYAADVLAQVVSYIRHSSLTDKEKKQLIEQIRETKFEPTNKVVPFDNGQ